VKAKTLSKLIEFLDFSKVKVKTKESHKDCASQAWLALKQLKAAADAISSPEASDAEDGEK